MRESFVLNNFLNGCVVFLGDRWFSCETTKKD